VFDYAEQRQLDNAAENCVTNTNED
jgi:hypothetical protein